MRPCGGQVADTGVIRNADGGVFEVKDTIKLQGGRIGHVGKVVSGMFYVGDAVTLEINEEQQSGYRKKPQRNPSCCRRLCVLFWVLMSSRQVPIVITDRLRFDFTHFSAL